jgi:non-specific serine/threonine protein kinase
MRVAGMLIDRFDDGVTVVEFAALRDSAGTAQVIAHALDVQQRGHQTIETTIEEHLAPTRSLLLLDGCEHLTAGIAPIVARLRAACPDLRILATSRQPLGLAGEYIEALAPLTIPDPDVESIDDLRRFAAVELFIARAAASSPGFTLTEENARPVADICQRLDGLPLALELAAARVRNMGVDALAGRLHQRIEMLGQTQRGADGRQRSLHDLVKWSYDLLGSEEQQVFEQLAVFAGGFDLVAAESVCSIDNSHIPTISHLASLGDKSMVVLVTSNPLRYRVLEPLRVRAGPASRTRDTRPDRASAPALVSRSRRARQRRSRQPRGVELVGEPHSRLRQLPGGPPHRASRSPRR